MSLLSPRLQLKVSQKQILTPGLVQMVTILQLNRLELKEMVTQEIVQNPVLEESLNEPGEEITPEELLPLLEAEHLHDPADKQLLEAAVLSDANSVDDGLNGSAINGNLFPDAEESAAAQVVAENDSLAVNDPLVVLAGAEVSFVRPVRVGERLRATAAVGDAEGRKRQVHCLVRSEEGEVVLHGRFTCVIPSQHVLAQRTAPTAVSEAPPGATS